MTHTQIPKYDVDEILASPDFLGSIHSVLPNPLDGLDDQLYEAELIVRGAAEFEGVIGNGISAFVFNQNFDLLEQSLWSPRRLGKSHALNAMEELESLIRESGFPDPAESRRQFYDRLQGSELESIDDSVRSINERYFADGSDQNLWDDRTVINMARKCLEDSIELLRNRKAWVQG
jgi:hypothetical protein